MSAASLEKIRADALALLGKVVGAYARDIGCGEVGADGSARATDSTPGKACTGLLYGRIQSGEDRRHDRTRGSGD